MKSICVVIGSRANYSSIKSAMKAISLNRNLQLQIVCMASSVLERFGNVSSLIEKDGFSIDEKCFSIVEGETPTTMAMSTGIGLIELPTIFSRLKPDIVLTVGDRFETMATVLAAAYMNIPIAHTMGGEVSGSIDESIRHAITKFSHIHFPATKKSAERIKKLGELDSTIHFVGCPRIDLVKNVIDDGNELDEVKLFHLGVGDTFSLKEPFILISQHPVTSEYFSAEEQMKSTLSAIDDLDISALILWPNSDAGSGKISRAIRTWRENRKGKSNVHFFKNLPTEDYIRLMQRTSCLVGNSSSGIREGAFIGVPVVNIGTRQLNRERAQNVLDVTFDSHAINSAIQEQIQHGKFESSHLYGEGNAGAKIADILVNLGEINTQKIISY